MSGPLLNQVAESIPFDNSTNGFTAENVQEAIEESKSKIEIKYYTATATTDVTRTANTFASVTDMNITPEAGTYLALWSAEIRMGTVSGRGEVGVFVGGVQQTALTRVTELEVTLLLGLLGVAQIEEGAGNIVGVITANGSQAVQIGIRSVDGQTLTVGRRSFTLLRIS